jgi:hypothetical protein
VYNSEKWIIYFFFIIGVYVFAFYVPGESIVSKSFFFLQKPKQRDVEDESTVYERTKYSVHLH